MAWNPYTLYGTLNALERQMQNDQWTNRPVAPITTPSSPSANGFLQSAAPAISTIAQSFQKPEIENPAESTGTIVGDWKSMNKGQKANAALGVGMGALSLGMDIASIGSQSLNLGKAPSVSYQEGTMPTYQTGDFMNRAYKARPQGASFGQVLGTTAKGAQIGAQLGGGVGAAIGAGIGAIGGLVAGGAAKRRQRREKERALNQARAQQAEYNERALDFSQQQTAQNEYRRRNDPYERMSNFYTA